jgi:ribosomal protein S18
LPHWCSIALSLLNNPDCFNPLYEKQSKPSTPIEYPKAVSKPAGLVSSERDIPNHVNPQWHKENNSSAERREKANNLLKQLTSQEYKLDTSDYQKFRLLKQGTKEWEDIRPGRATGTTAPNLWGTPGHQVSVREQYKRIFEGKKPKTSQFVQKNFARGHRVEEHVKAIIPEIFKTTFGVNVVAKETGSYLAPQDFTFGLDPDAFKDSGYSPEKFLASPDIIIDLDPGDEGITTETTTEDNNSANDYENDADSDCDSGDNNKEKPTSTIDNNSDSDNTMRMMLTATVTVAITTRRIMLIVTVTTLTAMPMTTAATTPPPPPPHPPPPPPPLPPPPITTTLSQPGSPLLIPLLQPPPPLQTPPLQPQPQQQSMPPPQHHQSFVYVKSRRHKSSMRPLHCIL